MAAWLTLIILAAATGALCARFLTGWVSFVCSAALPWLGLLAWLLYNEYFVPYRGGGASMWPIAQLFGGSVAAFAGIVSCALTLSTCQGAKHERAF